MLPVVLPFVFTYSSQTLLTAKAAFKEEAYSPQRSEGANCLKLGQSIICIKEAFILQIHNEDISSNCTMHHIQVFLFTLYAI